MNSLSPLTSLPQVRPTGLLRRDTAVERRSGRVERLLRPARTRIFLFLLFASLAGAHRLRAAWNEGAPLFTRLSGTVVVPAELTNGSLFVTVTINGRGPYRMMVDTGSSIALVTPAVAAAVGARAVEAEDGGVEALNAFGEHADVRRVLLRTLEIGGVLFEGVTAGVADSLRAFGRLDQRPVDGLLGYSVFSDLVLGLDFPGRRVLMSATWPAGLPPVRTELEVHERLEVPMVSVRLQGRDFDVLVDTGSGHSLGLTPELAQVLHWKAEPRPGHLVLALGDAGREYIGRLAGELHVGRVTQQTPIADIMEGAPSVGVGFLKGFCVVFDQNHDKMWLCSESDDPVPAPAARSLGLSLFKDNGGWRVAGTIPGSPAEGAGIASGDMVTEIEGEPARSWTKDRLDGWTDTHERVVLRVARVDQSRDLVLPVWPLVP